MHLHLFGEGQGQKLLTTYTLTSVWALMAFHSKSIGTFGALIASTLLGRFSARFWSVSVGISAHLSRSFVRSDSCWRGSAWLAVILVHLRGVWWGWDQGFVRASQVLLHQAHSTMPLWIYLCALGHSHAGKEKTPPNLLTQTWKIAIYWAKDQFNQ